MNNGLGAILLIGPVIYAIWMFAYTLVIIFQKARFLYIINSGKTTKKEKNNISKKYSRQSARLAKPLLTLIVLQLIMIVWEIQITYSAFRSSNNYAAIGAILPFLYFLILSIVSILAIPTYFYLRVKEKESPNRAIPITLIMLIILFLARPYLLDWVRT